MLAPRIAYKVTDGITAEVAAVGLVPRREVLHSTIGDSVLLSVVKRW